MKVKFEKYSKNVEVGIGWFAFYDKEEKTFNIEFILGNKLYTIIFK